MAWLIGRDPQITILYCTNRDEEAKRRNLWCLGVMSTEDYERVFGAKALPLRSKCSASKITCKGKADRNDANVQVFGIEGIRAGEHYDIAIVDDVCDTRSSHSQPAKKANIKEVFHQQVTAQVNPRSMGMGRLGVGQIFGQGTSYADDDLNSELGRTAKESMEADGRWIYHRVACVYNVTESGVTATTPYPTVLPEEKLIEEWESNQRAAEMNYALLAVGADEKPFESVHFYLHEKYVQQAKEWGIWSEQVGAFGYEPGMLPWAEVESPDESGWFRIMVIDPGFSEKADSSCTGICIGGLAPNGDIYILYGGKRRQRWNKTVQEIPQLYQKYGCDLCLFEVAGQQEAAFYSLEKELKADCGVARIETVKPGNRGKTERAQFIGPRVNAGRVLLEGHTWGGNTAKKIGPTKSSKALYDDLLAFPACAEADLVDAFVYLVQELRPRAARLEKESPAPLSPVDEERRIFQEGVQALIGAKKPESKHRNDLAVAMETQTGGTPWLN